MVKSSPGVSPKPRFGPNLDLTESVQSRSRAWWESWPLNDIAITNIVWQVLQYRMVGGNHYIAQNSMGNGGVCDE